MTLLSSLDSSKAKFLLSGLKQKTFENRSLLCSSLNITHSLKNGNIFGIVAQETSYKLSSQSSVAIIRNHPCLIGMK